MGCDIHIYVEKKTGKKWEAMPMPEGWEYGEEFENWLYNGRNYRLFAILADVRNYDELEVISESRGLPEDASERVRSLAEGLPEEYGSFSWLVLQELLDFDWDRIAGETTRYVSPEEAEAYLNNGKKPAGGAMATSEPSWKQVTWKVTYRDIAGDFLEALQKLCFMGKPENLRIVFWFDN